MTFSIQTNTADQLKAAAVALLSDDELLEALRDREVATTDNELLRELRDRMGEHGVVVKLVPFSTVAGDPEYEKWCDWVKAQGKNVEAELSRLGLKEEAAV